MHRRAALALAGLVASALGPATAHAQSATVSVSARNSTSGGIGGVQLAAALDVTPPGAGPEDLPASAPTTPAISCRSDGTGTCAGSAAVGSTVVLQALDVSNATFVGWVGCSSTTPAPGLPPRCNVAVTGARTVTAWFKPTTYQLTAATTPVPTATFHPAHGGHVVAPATPAIDCQTGDPAHAACRGAVPNGAAITLTAFPSAGSRVTGWGGCTPVSATTCRTPAMTSPRTVTVAFGPTTATIEGVVSGPGTLAAAAGGAVLDGMACPGDCEATVSLGGSITFAAAAAEGYELLTWDGCVSTTPTCTLANVTAGRRVTATFVSSACRSCHGTPPPAPHLARTDCGTCHPGYTQRSTVPALHLNGRVDPRHEDALGEGCAGDADDSGRCLDCHPCFGR